MKTYGEFEGPENYYHFTNIKSLEHILETKSLFLNQALSIKGIQIEVYGVSEPLHALLISVGP